MLLNKLLGYATMVLGASCIVLLITVQFYRMENENLTLQLVGWKSSHDKQTETITSLLELSGKDADRINNLTNMFNKSQRETENANIELSRLRYSEAEKALEKPFARGVASDNRKRAMLLRFSGKKPNSH
jgi:hypothetical protein